MKIINNRIMAQSVAGTNVNTAALINDPNVCAGWSLFFFTGKLPTSKEGFEAAFNTKSLADMYNKSIGITRSPVYGIENGNVIAMTLQNQYIPKGTSYYGQIGTAKIDVRQLLPDRIQRNLTTDRNIVPVAASANTVYSHSRYGVTDDIVLEFDHAVTLTHVKFLVNNSATGFTWFGIKDDDSEVSLGTMAAVPGESFCYSFSAPASVKKIRLKNSGSVAPSDATFTLLTNVDAAPAVAQTAPTWAVLAHCNTMTHGDTDYSDQIMFTAGAVGNQGPFKILGQIVPNVRTLVYCPKLRFTQRSS